MMLRSRAAAAFSLSASRDLPVILVLLLLTAVSMTGMGIAAYRLGAAAFQAQTEESIGSLRQEPSPVGRVLSGLFREYR